MRIDEQRARFADGDPVGPLERDRGSAQTFLLVIFIIVVVPAGAVLLWFLAGGVH